MKHAKEANEHRTRSEKSALLRNILSQRVDEVIATRCPKKRGRINWLSQEFAIHYTTAQRIMRGDSLPALELLHEIANRFNVSESWLCGRDLAPALESPKPSPMPIVVEGRGFKLEVTLSV